MYVTNGDGKGGGISGEISGLGKAIGVLSSMLLTPLVFRASAPALFQHFAKSMQRDHAEIMMWVSGGIEAYIIYKVVSITFALVSIWAVTAMIERGLKR